MGLSNNPLVLLYPLLPQVILLLLDFSVDILPAKHAMTSLILHSVISSFLFSNVFALSTTPASLYRTKTLLGIGN